MAQAGRGTAIVMRTRGEGGSASREVSRVKHVGVADLRVEGGTTPPRERKKLAIAQAYYGRRGQWFIFATDHWKVQF